MDKYIKVLEEVLGDGDNGLVAREDLIALG
jgi:hypothetical protein